MVPEKDRVSPVADSGHQRAGAEVDGAGARERADLRHEITDVERAGGGDAHIVLRIERAGIAEPERTGIDADVAGEATGSKPGRQDAGPGLGQVPGAVQGTVPGGA